METVKMNKPTRRNPKNWANRVRRLKKGESLCVVTAKAAKSCYGCCRYKGIKVNIRKIGEVHYIFRSEEE